MKRSESAGQINLVKVAHQRWWAASNRASVLAEELFQAGSGYGDPEARHQDEHRLHTARHEADRMFREYSDIAQRDTEAKLLQLQQSQRLATWASFAVAAVVGVATIVTAVVALAK